jgi:uncharacterized protein
MPNDAGDFHIAIFCRAPVAGAVKTRLIPTFGAVGATDIYVQLAKRTFATVRATCDQHEATASLWVVNDTGSEAEHACIQRWAHEFNWPVYRQKGADLGERMLHCLQTMCTRHQRVLLLGTDCPTLTRTHLFGAANSLTASNTWTFIPAEDGGYVLVGSNKPCSTPFSNIAWSTAVVMQQTRQALATAQLGWAETVVLWDVDEPADVHRAVLAQLLSMSPT